LLLTQKNVVVAGKILEAIGVKKNIKLDVWVMTIKKAI